MKPAVAVRRVCMTPAALLDCTSPHSPVLIVVCSAQWDRPDAMNGGQREDLGWVEVSLLAA